MPRYVIRKFRDPKSGEFIPDPRYWALVRDDHLIIVGPVTFQACVDHLNFMSAEAWAHRHARESRGFVIQPFGTC